MVAFGDVGNGNSLPTTPAPLLAVNVFFKVEIDRLVVCLLDWLIESTGQLQTQPVKRGATSERENRNWRKMQVRVHQVKTSLLP